MRRHELHRLNRGIVEQAARNVRLQLEPTGTQPVELRVQAFGCIFPAAPGLLQRRHQRRQELVGIQLAGLQQLVKGFALQLRAFGHLQHGLLEACRRARNGLTQLQAQFLRLNLALGEHLLQGEQRAVAVFRGQVQRGRCLGEGVKQLLLLLHRDV